MRNLLALVGLGTVTFLGLGWYLGWYKLEKSPSGPGNIQVGIDTRRVTTDVQRGIKGVSELVDSLSANREATQTSWYEQPPASLAPPKTAPLPPAPSWYDTTPVPPATNKPSGWRPITPAKR